MMQQSHSKMHGGLEGDGKVCVYLDSSESTQPSRVYAVTVPACQEMP